MELVCACYFAVVQDFPLVENSIAANFFEIVGIPAGTAASWLLALLLVHKPANIMIQKMLAVYKPAKKGEEIRKDNNAGRFIGTIERIIMLILISIEQVFSDRSCIDGEIDSEI